MEIIKVYKENFPTLKLIGKKYLNSDRDQYGTFSKHWDTWFQKGWFKPLDEVVKAYGGDDAYLGCMRNYQGFEYWIGILASENAEVPEGYQCELIPASEVGICWVYGSPDNGELYSCEVDRACEAKFLEQGWQVVNRDGSEKNSWFFERYACPRFIEKDEKGNVILDFGVYLNSK